MNTTLDRLTERAELIRRHIEALQIELRQIEKRMEKIKSDKDGSK